MRHLGPALGLGVLGGIVTLGLTSGGKLMSTAVREPVSLASVQPPVSPPVPARLNPWDRPLVSPIVPVGGLGLRTGYALAPTPTCLRGVTLAPVVSGPPGNAVSGVPSPALPRPAPPAYAEAGTTYSTKSPWYDPPARTTIPVALPNRTVRTATLAVATVAPRSTSVLPAPPAYSETTTSYSTRSPWYDPPAGAAVPPTSPSRATRSIAAADVLVAPPSLSLLPSAGLQAATSSTTRSPWYAPPPRSATGALSPASAASATVVAPPLAGLLPFVEAHWQGLELLPNAPALAKSLGIPLDEKGVIVDEATMPADSAGFLAGDLVMNVGQVPTPDLTSFIGATSRVRARRRAEVEILRKGVHKTLVLTALMERLGTANGETAQTIAPGARPPHDYLGPCTNCHRIGTLAQLAVDQGDQLVKTAPRIYAGQQQPHKDRGTCTSCHEVIVRGAPPPPIRAGQTCPHADRGTCTLCHEVLVSGSRGNVP